MNCATYLTWPCDGLGRGIGILGELGTSSRWCDCFPSPPLRIVCSLWHPTHVQWRSCSEITQLHSCTRALDLLKDHVSTPRGLETNTPDCAEATEYGPELVSGVTRECTVVVPAHSQCGEEREVLAAAPHPVVSDGFLKSACLAQAQLTQCASGFVGPWLGLGACEIVQSQPQF